MKENPYTIAPPSAFWARSIAQTAAGEVDPAKPLGVRISPESKVVSAGSCFAANIARYLRKAGFRYLVTETMHPLLASTNPAFYEKLGYGAYSAGYGNIYTARQMTQLLQRAFGKFSPLEDRWMRDKDVICPFRPRLAHPARSEREFNILRHQHFRAVRSAFEQADFFVFTLGLTEAWRSRIDGAVYPACPGTIAGDYDPKRHEFVNFSVDDVYQDIRNFVEFLNDINPQLQVILTVSPVPLVATATGNHVLVASTYSKAVLRVAADKAEKTLSQVYYFPAYEIVTGPHASGRYLEPDRRNVTTEAVDHVMRVFFKNLTTGVTQPVGPDEPAPEVNRQAKITSLVESALEAACEEELVEINSRPRQKH